MSSTGAGPCSYPSRTPNPSPKPSEEHFVPQNALVPSLPPRSQHRLPRIFRKSGKKKTPNHEARGENEGAFGVAAGGVVLILITAFWHDNYFISVPHGANEWFISVARYSGVFLTPAGAF